MVAFANKAPADYRRSENATVKGAATEAESRTKTALEQMQTDKKGALKGVEGDQVKAVSQDESKRAANWKMIDSKVR